MNDLQVGIAAIPSLPLFRLFNFLVLADASSIHLNLKNQSPSMLEMPLATVGRLLIDVSVSQRKRFTYISTR
jgi:hypothetical protein